MKLFSDNDRPVLFGPYPLERLKRQKQVPPVMSSTATQVLSAKERQRKIILCCSRAGSAGGEIANDLQAFMSAMRASTGPEGLQ